MRFFERRIVHLQVTMRELVGPCEQGGGGLLGETAPSGIFDARHADISGHIVAGQGAQQDKKKSSSRSTNYRYANYCSHSRAGYCSPLGELRSGSGCHRGGYESQDPLLASDFNKHASATR